MQLTGINGEENGAELQMEGLSEEERKALRGSKFAPLPPPSSRSQQPRLAHPGGPLKTNKAAALAKFLERKLQDPNGLTSINPDLIESAVKSAKDTVSSSGTSRSGKIIHHVTSFGDSEDSAEEGKAKESSKKHKKKKKKKKKHKKRKMVDDSEHVKLKKPKK
ncbi:uncharacterized protein LOC110610754 [Manihot esculenta]|uniref:Uncharacterized protein n=1 Tax=Manihot esculenta TaxID=3983 RepID=A0A251LCG6_MANES|nr:uncharacterized protein LOC110610754 [Manihot esculenta]XP_021606508.1 uncharacterized protein LOC110610754 [Manihot esculenta]OAY55966.1 hypothetical protein MANES_03G192600v8 [Manihot esculenta]